MIAKQEVWPRNTCVWVGKYKNSYNLLHWHYDCEFISVERGRIEVFCGKKLHVLETGDSLLIDSEEVHYMQAKEEGTVLIVMIFDYHIVKPYLSKYRLASPRLTGKYHVAETYERALACLKSKTPLCEAEASIEILKLMVEIFRREELAARESGSDLRSLKYLLRDVNEHFERYTFEDAASFMNMSEAYFSRFFHKTAGVTFTRYLNHVRCENAIRLLGEGGRSVTEVSERCGFGTVRSFNRIFKELTGYTPRELPRGFVLQESLRYASPEQFNPSLMGCELVESSEER